jgi:YesN/AraC family two-component response regulator
MADRKPFLVESFSLGDLASVLFTNKVYLSKTINYYSGKNFRSYINYYRVMYAMELFRRNKSLTVSELGSLAGFHSGTTFNQAFKAVMQESPSTWCARLRKKNREYPK